MSWLLKVKYVSLPNLIVGNQVVPELLVHNCTVDSIARELSSLLQNSPQREWQVNSYKAMRRKLGTSVASKYAAELLVDSLRPGLAAGALAGAEAVQSVASVSCDADAAPRPRKPRRRRPQTEGEAAPKTKSVAAESRKPDVADSAEQTGPPRPRPRRRKPRPRPRTETSE